MTKPRSILITGASSGIGAALARAYAGPGTTLFLGGRDAGRTNAIAAECRDAGADARGQMVDVTNPAAMQQWVVKCDSAVPIDLVIANAGISAGSGGGGEPAEQVRAVFATNLGGVLNTVLPAIERMRPRRAGQIALMASVAGYRGLPGAPAYCASKAAVKVWGEGLRGALAEAGLSVSVICPGYIDTPMTRDNPYPMPFLIAPNQAARIIVRGLAQNRARISFPWPMAAVCWLLQVLPAGVVDGLFRRLPAKPAGRHANTTEAGSTPPDEDTR